MGDNIQTRLVIDTSDFDKGLQGASGHVDKFERSVDSAGGKTGGFGSKLGGIVGGLGGMVGPLALVTGGVGLMMGAFGEATEAQEGMAQLDAVLKSTGQKAGVTKEQVLGLADSLSSGSGLSKQTDDAILSAENMLLTFTNIGSDTFPLATQAVLDMAQATGGDMKGASIQLGKALNDPIAGVAALSDVGVTFTAAQKEVIKSLVETGDVAGAQKVILNELGGEFGGSAAAAADTFGGKMLTLQEKFNGVLQAVGEGVLPIITALVDFLTSADFSAFISQVGDGIGNAISTVMNLLGPIMDAFGSLFGLFKEGGEGADGLGEVLGNLGEKFMEMEGKILKVIADALPGIIAKLGEWGAAFLNFIGTTVLPFIGAKLAEFGTAVWTWLTGQGLQDTITNLKLWGGAFLDWIKNDALPFIVQKLGELGSAIWTWISGGGLLALIKNLVTWGGAFLGWIAKDVLPTIATKLGEFGTAVWNWITQTALPTAITKMGEFAAAFLDWVGKDVIPTLGEKLGAIWDGIVKWVDDTVDDVVEKLKELGGGIVDGIRKGVADAWNSFVEWIKGLIRAIPIIGKKLLGEESPSTVFAEIGMNLVRGFQKGIEDEWPNLTQSLKQGIGSLPGLSAGGGGFGIMPGVTNPGGFGRSGGGGGTQNIFIDGVFQGAIIDGRLAAHQALTTPQPPAIRIGSPI